MFKISHHIKEEYVTLFVEDASPGIPDNAIKYIFDRLYRVEQSKNRSS
jgi:signal transduction histidine kinase